jgi:hypothetical protein
MPDREIIEAEALMVTQDQYPDEESDLFFVVQKGTTLTDFMLGEAFIICETYDLPSAIRIAKAWNRENRN